MKWYNILFLSSIAFLFLGIGLRLDLLLGIAPLAGLAFWLCIIILDFSVWKSWRMILAVLSLIPTPLAVIISMFAYRDGIRIVKKAGYSVGLLGPREITLFGKRHV